MSAALASLAVPRLWSGRMRRLVAAAALALAAAAFLGGPTAWSATTLKAAVQGVFPGAGPSFVSGLSTRSTGGFFGGRGGFTGRPRGFTPPAGRNFGPPQGWVPGLGRPGGFRGGAPGGGFGSSSDVQTALTYAKAHGATKRFALRPPSATIVCRRWPPVV